MQVNSVGATNVSYKGQQEQGGSAVGYVMQSIFTDALLGAGFNAAWTHFTKMGQDDFTARATSVIDKTPDDKVKVALKDKLGDIFANQKTKELEELYKNDQTALKAAKEVVSKVKTQRLLKSAGMGAAICGAIGLVFGLINVHLRKKAEERARHQ